jgi:hypothetical protein
MAGPTLWMNHYRVTLLEVADSPDQVRIVAEHDGYRGLGIIHRRAFHYLKTERKIILDDDIVIKGKQKVHLDMPFHIHPDFGVSPSGKTNCFKMEQGENILQIILDPALQCSLRKGETQPPLGWYSPSFYKKIPAFVILGESDLIKSCTLHTEILITDQ